MNEPRPGELFIVKEEIRNNDIASLEAHKATSFTTTMIKKIHCPLEYISTEHNGLGRTYYRCKFSKGPGELTYYYAQEDLVPYHEMTEDESFLEGLL